MFSEISEMMMIFPYALVIVSWNHALEFTHIEVATLFDSCRIVKSNFDENYLTHSNVFTR